MMRGVTGVVRRGCAVLAALCLLGGVGRGLAAAEEEGFTPIPVIKGMELLATGTEAPTFQVRDLAGNDFDFSQESTKKAHLLVFWSIFCEPCREEMPIIEQIYQEFKERDFAVLAVNLDGEPFLEGIRGYIKQYSYSFPVLLDQLDGEAFRVADPYQVAGTPVLYLIDGEGKVHTTHLGRITVKELRELVSGMLDKR